MPWQHYSIYSGPRMGSGRNGSITEVMDGDVLFWFILLFVLFAVYIGWRVRRALKEDEKRDSLRRRSARDRYK